MVGSRLPVVVAHGEGRAVFDDDVEPREACVALGYVDNLGSMTESLSDESERLAVRCHRPLQRPTVESRS